MDSRADRAERASCQQLVWRWKVIQSHLAMTPHCKRCKTQQAPCCATRASPTRSFGASTGRPFWLKPFWLKWIPGLKLCVFLLPSLFVPRRVEMPRGRWVFPRRVVQGMWQQVLRGRRPPSVQWPQRRNQSAAAQPLQPPQNGQRPNRSRRWQGQGGQSRPPTNHVESRTPDDDAAVLQSRIEKLEESHRGPRRREPRGPMVGGGVEESSETSHIVTNWGSVGFLPGLRGTCPEAFSSCRGGRCQGSSSEEHTRVPTRTGTCQVGEAAAQPDHPVGGVVPHEDELSRLKARVAELEAQRAGSHHATDPPATIPAQSAEEINLLRATVAELRRERTSLLSEVARQTDVSGSTRIETLIDDAELDSRISQRFAPY